ncbi:MAG: laccase domain-containing protein, partial [Desulfotignum sp.]
MTDSPLRFLSFSQYPQVIHGVFTRRGGVSQPPFDTLNVGYSSGDDADSVTRNRNRVLSQLDMPRAVFLNQVHGTD